MTSKVSIVVPVYKTEHCLPMCLQSLLDQSEKNFEIVVVDDCSPGDCRSIVEKFQTVKPSIKYVRHSTNLGVLCARFTGVEHSTGNYVGYLDSDDAARPNFVEVLLAAATETGADIIGSFIKETDERSRFVIEGAEELLKAYANGTIPTWSMWSKLYKRDLILSLNNLHVLAKQNRFNLSEDLLFNVYCAVKGPIYVQLPDVLVDYNRDRSDSATNNVAPGQVIQDLKSCILSFETIRNLVTEFEKYTYELMRLSALFFYDTKFKNCSAEELELATSYLMSAPGGNLVLSPMLRAAEQDRRIFADQLSNTTTKLADAKNKLADERKKIKELRSRLNKSEATRRALEQTGLLKFLRIWRSRLRPSTFSARMRR